MTSKKARITDFDFNDPATRERLKRWLMATIVRIEARQGITEPDLLKMAELLKLLYEKEEYKIPYGRGQRKTHSSAAGTVVSNIRDEQLICWYRITLETELNKSATEAKEATAQRFLVSEKTVEKYCTRHRKLIEHMIEKYGYDEISYSYIEHLSIWRKGKEALLVDFLKKYQAIIDNFHRLINSSRDTPI